MIWVIDIFSCCISPMVPSSFTITTICMPINHITWITNVIIIFIIPLIKCTRNPSLIVIMFIYISYYTTSICQNPISIFITTGIRRTQW